jgi:Spy/CpxP family protein refolding chaperone
MNPKHCAAILAVMLTCAVAVSAATDQKSNKPPKGFTALFDGKDLNGWRGR